MTAPRPDGAQAARAMRLALADAAPGRRGDRLRQRPRLVDAAQRPDRDGRDQAGLRRPRATGVAVSGTKGYYGHALGASGAIEAAICALASQPRLAAADREPRHAGSGLRPGLSRRRRAERPARSISSATRSGSAGSTPPWSSDGPTEPGALPFHRSPGLDSRRPAASTSATRGLPMNSMFRRLVAEALGTFALIFIGAGVDHCRTISPRRDTGLLGIALAHATALGVMITATMNISGGHLNPAVTVGMLAVAADRRQVGRPLHRRPADRCDAGRPPAGGGVPDARVPERRVRRAPGAQHGERRPGHR